MQIPLLAFFGPDGSRQSIRSSLNNDETESILTTGISAVTNKLLDSPTSAFLGIVHRSMGIQLYAYISCTGWMLLLGLEPGPYDSDEVARSLMERAYSAVINTCVNPFFTILSKSPSFVQHIESITQSHSVMIRFMTSSQSLG
jgi:hypothetical protein